MYLGTQPDGFKFPSDLQMPDLLLDLALYG